MYLKKSYNKNGKRTLILGINKSKLKLRKPNTKIKVKRPKVRIKVSTLNFLYNISLFLKNNIFFILSFIFMGIIFMFSNQPGNTSSNLSNNVEGLFKDFYIFNFLFGIFNIRKIAHFSLYFCLSYFIFKTVQKYKVSKLFTSIYLSVFLTFIYACSDEFHQLFVSGRGASFRDVLIDTFGAICCMSLILVFNFVKNHVKNKQNVCYQ